MKIIIILILIFALVFLVSYSMIRAGKNADEIISNVLDKGDTSGKKKVLHATKKNADA